MISIKPLVTSTSDSLFTATVSPEFSPELNQTQFCVTRRDKELPTGSGGIKTPELDDSEEEGRTYCAGFIIHVLKLEGRSGATESSLSMFHLNSG